MRVILILLAVFSAVSTPARDVGKARHVVVIVWDGMRPDFVSEQNTPALWELTQHGVIFENHHAVYLSSTEVNGAAIATGDYPGDDGIVGNKEYRPEIDAEKFVHTESLAAVRKGDTISGGRYLRAPTLAEILQHAGRKTMVAGAKGVALLHDRAERGAASLGTTVFAGETLPENALERITNLYGEFPKTNRNDWITSGVIDPLWKDGVPDFSLIWMNEPDLTQHFTGPGSKASLAAIKNADENL
ncbi:MAG TPA: alkaline phosphatase family protein, partial [Verrucomicrobiae bacterium]|nr:alkaline phosphatase family protein [Verrucomicrobiae bacterium]